LIVLQMDMAIYTYEYIMRITENLSEKYIIGYGASSIVYKCVLKTAKPIAIKRLYSHYPHNLHEFETELETVGSIRHRNLVSLHGYSLSPHGNLLFFDYMENGSLWDLLHGILLIPCLRLIFFLIHYAILSMSMICIRSVKESEAQLGHTFEDSSWCCRRPSLSSP